MQKDKSTRRVEEAIFSVIFENMDRVDPIVRAAIAAALDGREDDARDLTIVAVRALRPALALLPLLESIHCTDVGIIEEGAHLPELAHDAVPVGIS